MEVRAMKKNKDMTPVDGTGQKKEGKKLPYEKPTIKAIALFADQVLNTCGKHVSIENTPCYLAVNIS
jgi:hypothetical protein